MLIEKNISTLIDLAIKKELITEQDKNYCANRIIAILKLEEFHFTEDLFVGSIADIIDSIIDYAVKNNIIEDLFDLKEILAANIMNVFVSKPTEINNIFYEKYYNSPEDATKYFYKLSCNSNYIQTKRIAKNIVYKSSTDYGDLDITINMSKPEKNPKDIAAQRNKKSSNYPKCLLCIENEGYEGKIGNVARANHRLIQLDLCSESWKFQYSPYSYYNEHCIILSDIHRDMKISKETFEKLLSFVEIFPHYFLGSNADLPIVGGSILTHDHYQGGCYEFAMAKADDEFKFKVDKFKKVEFSVVKWPMSVIRVKSKNKQDIIDVGTHIFELWKNYSDPDVDIHAFTGKDPHNTITPIARIKNGLYEMDFVLRNNKTSEEHPLGIYHPHKDVQHIKKENIGLIEVMGLAVLPARLKDELQEVQDFILNIGNNVADCHKEWAISLKEKYKDTANENNIREIVRKEVGNKFLRVLQDAGVFKCDKKGIKAFKKFISILQKI